MDYQLKIFNTHSEYLDYILSASDCTYTFIGKYETPFSVKMHRGSPEENDYTKDGITYYVFSGVNEEQGGNLWHFWIPELLEAGTYTNQTLYYDGEVDVEDATIIVEEGYIEPHVSYCLDEGCVQYNRSKQKLKFLEIENHANNRPFLLEVNGTEYSVPYDGSLKIVFNNVITVKSNLTRIEDQDGEFIVDTGFNIPIDVNLSDSVTKIVCHNGMQ